MSADEELDSQTVQFERSLHSKLAKVRNEIICWLVGSVGISVLLNHFLR